MEIQDIIDSITGLIRQIFFFPETWLEWPIVLQMVIIPVVLNWYAFYKILELLRIFGYGRGINFVVAFVLSFFLIPIAPITIFFSVGAIFLLGLKTWKSRIVFAAVLVIIYLMVIPFLYTVKV